MDPLVSAALETWSPRFAVLAFLFIVGFSYWRGWTRGRRLVRSSRDTSHLASFLGGLAVLGLALESPLDALDGLLLSAHMTQHLLLMMVAPPLLLLGQPTVPLLRGLPKTFVKEGLGPFLTWPFLRRLGHVLTAMPVTWLIFALSTIGWHMPRFYEVALHSASWHGVQHACFFWTGVLFWWPVILQEPAKRRWPEWTVIPYLLFADIVNTALSAFFIFSGKILYPSYEAIRISGFTAQDDQALAGAIMWVPGSIAYLLPAIVFAMRMLSLNRDVTGVSHSIVRMPRTASKKVGLPARSAKQLVIPRRWAQAVMLLAAIAVIVDGLLGPQLAPTNLAGVLPWIHWRGLSVVALLVLGNLFCMACPFVLVRDVGRKLLPASLRWPRMLRNKWLPVTLLVLYFWAYEAFALWDSPMSTAWIIIGYFAAALLIDGLFRGASFCKYVCPIGQFHFVTSLLSPREVRVRQQKVCESCRTHDCIRGNTTARGCELYLFQPKKQSSLDCTFCLDCVKACPHDNVALLPVLPASNVLNDTYRSSIGRLSRRTDYAALALLIVFGAFVNAAGMIGPVMMWEHHWHARLGVHGMQIAIGLFVLLGAVVLPVVLTALCAGLNRLLKLEVGLADLARRFVFAFVPIGIAMWAAHLFYHLGTSWTAAVPAVSRAFTGHLVTVGPGTIPSWLTPLQIVLLDAGVLLTLYLAWRLAQQYTARLSQALALWAPWSGVALALYAAGIWILLQPMDMRGMMH